jgi:2-polyprenyl-6-methoxyphenol hydroxylase-like FAD-dependent oxidoreductase
LDAVDVVIVGGGLGGSSLGAALAGAGRSVLLLERCTEFEDRVRGEWIAPWGVAEAKRLGLYDDLIETGGHVLTRNIGYDVLDSVEDVPGLALPLDALHPESDGPLCLEHVVMQNTLLGRAVRSGVDVRRGVSGVRIEPGPEPSIRFNHEGESIEVDCRLIVGADGRTSTVRRQAGIAMIEDPVDHLIAGLLIEGADEWPNDLQSTGQAGDLYYLVFPQSGGRIRLYADFGLDQRGRFDGPDGARKFLDCFDIDFLPHSQSIVGARPVGPCGSFPSQDARAETPIADGVVLIGDAAGYNDPIVGQGQSVTLRDVRIVSELLNGTNDWTLSLLQPYAEERVTRMHRLRMAARFATELYARFGPEATQRRKRARQRMRERPEIAVLLLAVFSGPENGPNALFTPEYVESIFAA